MTKDESPAHSCTNASAKSRQPQPEQEPFQPLNGIVRWVPLEERERVNQIWRNYEAEDNDGRNDDYGYD